MVDDRQWISSNNNISTALRMDQECSMGSSVVQPLSSSGKICSSIRKTCSRCTVTPSSKAICIRWGCQLVSKLWMILPWPFIPFRSLLGRVAKRLRDHSPRSSST